MKVKDGKEEDEGYGKGRSEWNSRNGWKGKGRGYRYALPNEEYYFKSQEEMKELFLDIPEAIDNISEIVDKIEVFQLKRDVLLPAFDIPEEFIHTEDEKDGGKRGENAYLRHITYEGAKLRYPNITDEIKHFEDIRLQDDEKTNDEIETKVEKVKESGILPEQAVIDEQFKKKEITRMPVVDDIQHYIALLLKKKKNPLLKSESRIGISSFLKPKKRTPPQLKFPRTWVLYWDTTQGPKFVSEIKS